jgi:hypothetical protein
MREKKRNLLGSHKNNKSDSQRPVPLSKTILNDFEQNFERDELFVENYAYLQRKNKVIDVMDDYYSRHISKLHI